MRWLCRVPLTVSTLFLIVPGVNAAAQPVHTSSASPGQTLPSPDAVPPGPGAIPLPSPGDPDLPPPHIVPPPAGVPLFPGPGMVSGLTRGPMTLPMFAREFRPNPTGGAYEVVLIHPITRCPVKVCFTLPCGCLREIRPALFGRWLTFDYGTTVVRIRFTGDGGYKVAYR